MRIGVRPLVASPVTPNHLTTMRMATGIGAACAFAVGTPEAEMTGAGVMAASLLLDRADGELARQSGRTSEAGHRYDLIADGLSNGAVFVGIGLGLADSALGLWAMVLGAATGAAALFSELLLIRLDTIGVQSTARLGGWWGFDPDDGMFLVPLAVLLGYSLHLLVLASVGATVVAIVFLTLLCRRNAPGAAAQDG